MRLFVSEYLCSGAVEPATSPASLLREGRSMLLALAADLARLEGIDVCTTWHAGLGNWPLPDVDAVMVKSAHDEEAAFRQLAEGCDAAYVIAPELDNLLWQRCRTVEELGRSLNSTLDAIALTSDKLRLFEHLRAAGVPKIPTQSLQNLGEPEFLCVVKPRFGAGSEETFVVTDAAAFRQVSATVDADEMIVQPFVSGTPCSVGAFFDQGGRLLTLLPPAAQHLSDDGRLKYAGGHCPLETPHTAALNNLVSAAAGAIDGLRGYVGFDLLIPHASPDQPLLVEINPRLTTSYLGYRALACDNLAAWLLPRTPPTDALHWRNARVTFRPDGTIAEAPAGTALTQGAGP
ncbi:carbamoyl phosphate synthase-like protein [Maioricimonas rarisocia]|uniref:Carbamoyl phosphate synthase-like protein n=1 Tax=Maioricimonas rarisocia TaxID=2528026 RepID=A0A517Z3B5_9PLAN|nr:ATP-grasp domain-containing protein [Maioricimonas rarisocia]QDU36917.1 carbamoyl phosphate synthase-like protein [Maioricimonas rarisocia]